jgi:hypothetical protein
VAPFLRPLDEPGPKFVVVIQGQGQELPEHSASMPAVPHVLPDKAKLTPGGGLDDASTFTALESGVRLQPSAFP